VRFSPIYTKQFEKDLRLSLRRGKDPEKIKEVIKTILAGKPLAPKQRDHKLVGNYLGRRDCHIEPDWILIYKPEPEKNQVIFERTGTHSDLFR
jgi:mRNA interferase YafQ